MPKGLYITATRPYSGKNTLCMGIGLRFQKEGLDPGYMKPVGALPTVKDGVQGDEDAFFMQDVLGLKNPMDLVCPVLVTQDFKMRAFSREVPDHMPDIVKAYEALGEKHELMILSGSGHMFSGKYSNLDAVAIAKRLQLKTIVIDRLQHEVNYDLLMAMRESLGDLLIGAVLNDVPATFMTEIKSVIQPFLERKGIPVLGVIPRDPLMGSIRANELTECLGGRLVAAQSRADRMVENFLIGTMQVENFLNYFRRNQNAAVIVGGDRADVQLVAIEGNCPCLVLTGNLYPNDIILSRADTMNVPIIMVREDTYTVAKKMEDLLVRHKLRDVQKIRQGSQLVSSTLNFNLIKESLGI